MAEFAESDALIEAAIEKLASMDIETNGMNREEILGLYEDIMFATAEEGYEYPDDQQLDEDGYDGPVATSTATLTESQSRQIAVVAVGSSGHGESDSDQLATARLNDSPEETGESGKHDMVHGGDTGKIEQICSALSITTDVAIQLLTICDWDVVQAISLYLTGSYETEDQSAEDNIRAPDTVKEERLVTESRKPLSRLDRVRLRSTNDADMVETSGDWIFTLPKEAPYDNVKLQLFEARELSLKSKKWLLVNIQSSKSFPCQEMNRDTWRDESISEVLKVYFVFWQRGVTSPGGLHFIKLYNICSEADLDTQEGISIFPGIYIIDPRTGALMKSISRRGFMPPGDLAQLLIEWCERHPSSAWEDLFPTFSSAVPPAPSSAVTTSSNSAVEVGVGSAVTTPVIVSFGPVLDEPNVSEPNTCTIAFRSNSSQYRRRFRQGDSIRSVFAFVQAKESVDYDIDILLHSSGVGGDGGVASVNLKNVLDKTIGDVGIANCKLIVRPAAA